MIAKIKSPYFTNSSHNLYFLNPLKLAQLKFNAELVKLVEIIT